MKISTENFELDTFWQSSTLEELCRMTSFDFVDTMARFLFRNVSIYENYVEKRKANLPEELNYLFVVCSLIFRENPNALLFLKRFTPDDRKIKKEAKKLLRSLEIEVKWQKEYKKLNIKKKSGKIHPAHKAFVALYERIAREKHISLALELGKIGNFDHKAPKDKQQYNKWRRSFERWRIKYEKDVVGYGKWPSAEFRKFLTMLSYKFVRLEPGSFVLMRTIDSDPQLNLIRRYAVNVLRHTEKEKLLPEFLSSRDERRYEKLLKKDELSYSEEKELFRLKLKRIRKNDEELFKEFMEEEFQTSHKEIYQRGALLGYLEFVRKLQWKYAGFEKVYLEESARYGRIVARRDLIFANGKLIQKGAILEKIRFRIWKDENGIDFLAAFENFTACCKYEYAFLYPQNIGVDEVELEINAARFFAFMEKGILSLVGEQLELQFKGSKYIPVLTKFLPQEGQ